MIYKNETADNLSPKFRKNSKILRFIPDLYIKALTNYTTSTVIPFTCQSEYKNALVIKYERCGKDYYFFFFHSILQLEYTEKVITFLYRTGAEKLKEHICSEKNGFPPATNYAKRAFRVNEALLHLIKDQNNCEREKIYDIRELLETVREKTANAFGSLGLRVSVISDMNADFFCALRGGDFIFMLFCVFDIFFRAGDGKSIIIRANGNENGISLKFSAPLDSYEKFDGFLRENFYRFALLDELCKANGCKAGAFEAVGENLVFDIRVPAADKVCDALSCAASDETEAIIAKELLYFV